MDKIKINLASGTSIEKPLITAFKGNEGDYVVLDNEINGTMGLPIILVTKLQNNSFSKVADKSAEWEAVKESLRLIIQGNHVNYITVPNEVGAEDLFFSQLTLPIPSFEALKNNYNVGADGASAPEVAAPAAAAAPAPEVAAPAPEVVAPAPEVAAPAPEVVAPAPEVVAPAPEVVAPAPVMPEAPAESQTLAEVSTDNSEEGSAPVDFTADKEAFLKACENMFDALVAKFQK